MAADPALAAFFIAIGASLAMALPISTPPNAIAYSTGAVKTRDMAVAGSIIGVVGWSSMCLWLRSCGISSGVAP